MSGTVIDALNFWARIVPGQPAIDFDGDVVTYAELSRWADGVAHDLAARGVLPGDRVSFVGTNTLEWCAAALGAMKVGASPRRSISGCSPASSRRWSRIVSRRSSTAIRRTFPDSKRS